MKICKVCGGINYKSLIKKMFFKGFIYLFMRDTKREAETQREKQDPCREPDAGLDPWTPGLGPEPKPKACSTGEPSRRP